MCRTVLLHTGNIRPSYRSTLKAIQLVSIFKVQDLQEVRINEIGPFMDYLKLLEQVCYKDSS